MRQSELVTLYEKVYEKHGPSGVRKAQRELRHAASDIVEGRADRLSVKADASTRWAMEVAADQLSSTIPNLGIMMALELLSAIGILTESQNKTPKRNPQ